MHACIRLSLHMHSIVSSYLVHLLFTTTATTWAIFVLLVISHTCQHRSLFQWESPKILAPWGPPEGSTLLGLQGPRYYRGEHNIIAPPPLRAFHNGGYVTYYMSLKTTAESLTKGQFGTAGFVLYKEVFLPKRLTFLYQKIIKIRV